MQGFDLDFGELPKDRGRRRGADATSLGDLEQRLENRIARCETPYRVEHVRYRVQLLASLSDARRQTIERRELGRACARFGRRIQARNDRIAVPDDMPIDGGRTTVIARDPLAGPGELQGHRQTVRMERRHHPDGAVELVSEGTEPGHERHVVRARRHFVVDQREGLLEDEISSDVEVVAKRRDQHEGGEPCLSDDVVSHVLLGTALALAGQSVDRHRSGVRGREGLEIGGERHGDHDRVQAVLDLHLVPLMGDPLPDRVFRLGRQHEPRGLHMELADASKELPALLRPSRRPRCAVCGRFMTLSC